MANIVNISAQVGDQLQKTWSEEFTKASQLFTLMDFELNSADVWKQSIIASMPNAESKKRNKGVTPVTPIVQTRSSGFQAIEDWLNEDTELYSGMTSEMRAIALNNRAMIKAKNLGSTFLERVFNPDLTDPDEYGFANLYHNEIDGGSSTAKSSIWIMKLAPDAVFGFIKPTGMFEVDGEIRKETERSSGKLTKKYTQQQIMRAGIINTDKDALWRIKNVGSDSTAETIGSKVDEAFIEMKNRWGDLGGDVVIMCNAREQKLLSGATNTATYNIVDSNVIRTLNNYDNVRMIPTGYITTSES